MNEKKSLTIPTKIAIPLMAILAALNLVLLAIIGAPLLVGQAKTTPVSEQYTPSVTPSRQGPVTVSAPSIQAERTSTLKPTSSVFPVSAKLPGVIILSLTDGNFSHLFAFYPQTLKLVQFTNGAWDDIDPAVSHDGKRIAFSSRRNGYWNIYILELRTQKLTRLTDTPDYDGSPTWSPDGEWLAYESYKSNNLEILVQSITELNQAPIQLTDNLAADYAPAWSPGGREIAFVSTRSGSEDIWLARLDRVDDRFINISQTPNNHDNHPTWSPNGLLLAWASDKNGLSTIYKWDSQDPKHTPHPAVNGYYPVWSPDGESLLAEVRAPNQTFLSIYRASNGELLLPLTKLPDAIHGLDWKDDGVAELVNQLSTSNPANISSTQLWKPVLTVIPLSGGLRYGVVQLQDVKAPFPYLHDAVDEAFNNLRRQTSLEIGWDFLATLESAFTPITEPPIPGIKENWLFTGRAFAANPQPMYAGWMVVVREDLGGQTYWRTYLKARFQDGSQGRPLNLQPWDLNARFSGNTQSYEQGGQNIAPPQGYWVDFTEITQRFGWQRLPASVNWRTYYGAALFNQFIMTDGLDWNSAMSELYPVEALTTPTPLPTPTPNSPSNGREKANKSTPATTLTPTLDPTLHPTWTPVAEGSSR